MTSSFIFLNLFLLFSSSVSYYGFTSSHFWSRFWLSDFTLQFVQKVDELTAHIRENQRVLEGKRTELDEETMRYSAGM